MDRLRQAWRMMAAGTGLDSGTVGAAELAAAVRDIDRRVASEQRHRQPVSFHGTFPWVRPTRASAPSRPFTGPLTRPHACGKPPSTAFSF